MIPDFDEHGNLPPGIHDATLDEVIERFSTPKSMRRKDLCERLVRFIGFVEEFAIIVYVDGSYVTSKLSPKDIDLIVVLPDDFDWNSSPARRLKGYQLKRSKNKLRIFRYLQTVEARTLQHRIEWFTRDKEDHNPKGIIRIEIRQ